MWCVVLTQSFFYILSPLTANAALQGKQVLLAKIEQESLDAHQQLETELQQLKQAKRSAKAAQQVSRKSFTQTFHRTLINVIELIFCFTRMFF